MANRRRLTELTPSEIARITQRAVLIEAEYINQHDYSPMNDDDSMTLRMLSILTATGMVDGSDGGGNDGGDKD